MNCVDTMFPSTDKDQIGTVEDNEELRCFYVAITRAKERLFLMAPKYIAKFGCVEEGIISHFISDVFQVKGVIYSEMLKLCCQCGFESM